MRLHAHFGRSYRWIRRLDAGVVAIAYEHEDGDNSQVWSLTRLRKPTTCATCGDDLEKGKKVFSPLTFQLNRADRLCVECVEKLERDP